MSEQKLAPVEELTYCEVHPDRETSLRCNKCNRLMCAECAVPTPVGYRCRECVRQQEDKFFNSTITDYGMIFAASAVIAGLGFVVTGLLGGFLLFIIVLAIPIGGAAAEAGLRLTGRRRGRQSGYIAAGGAVLGTLAASFLMYHRLIPSAGFLLPLLIYAGIVAATAYGRFRITI